MSISYEEFRAAIHDGARRRSLLFRDGVPFFVLLSQQFSRDELDSLMRLAEQGIGELTTMQQAALA